MLASNFFVYYFPFSLFDFVRSHYLVSDEIPIKVFDKIIARYVRFYLSRELINGGEEDMNVSG